MRNLSDDRGQATVFMALFLGLVMFGFMAFALDVGYMFHEKRMAQAAADAAALAAAEQGVTNGQPAANIAARMNGFDTTLATNPATVTLSSPPSGNYPSTAPNVPQSWVQAVVSQPIHTFFLGAFSRGMSSLTVSGSAVAAGGLTSGDCVCLEGTAGQDLSMSNGANFTGANCAVKVDSTSSNSIGVIGGANACPQAIGTAASSWDHSSNGPNVNNGGSVCPAATVVAPAPTCNPPMPAVPTFNAAQCTSDPLGSYGSGGSSYNIGPGSLHSTTQGGGGMVCYSGNVTVGSNNDIVTLNPGIYVINGGVLNFKSGNGGVSNLGGNGVLIYLTNGASLVIDNGANVNLTAPSSGTYSGILVYEDPGGTPSTDLGDNQPISVQGGANTVFNGAIYAPLAAINLGNGSGNTLHANVVAKTLNMYGGTNLSGSPNPNLGAVNVGGSSYLVQ